MHYININGNKYLFSHDLTIDEFVKKYEIPSTIDRGSYVSKENIDEVIDIIKMTDGNLYFNTCLDDLNPTLAFISDKDVSGLNIKIDTEVYESKLHLTKLNIKPKNENDIYIDVLDMIKDINNNPLCFLLEKSRIMFY